MEDLIAIKKELELERAARLEAETQVRELTGLADRLKTLIMALQTGVLVEDQNRRILLVNREFCKIFGIPA
jgi:PAS domain-containing protein